MREPLVCCVMLTADRPAMTARAVKCFLAQTYERKSLLIFDTGCKLFELPEGDNSQVALVRAERFMGSTIGALRNAANELAPGAHVIVHWDSDDWSHPSRVADQVELLQSSGADCVGYNELLFWREPWPSEPDRTKLLIAAQLPESFRDCFPQKRGEVWHYSNRNPAMPVGASLCYRRTTWKRQPFKDTHVGEDRDFCQRVECVAVSAMIAPRLHLIQSLHGGNTWDGDIEAAIRAGSSEWSRAAHWDDWVRGAMKL